MAQPDDGPRIPPVTEPDAEQAELLAKTLPTTSGRPLNVFATLAHNPRLLGRFNALGGYFLRYGTLSARDRELVILRVAALTGSRYEEAQHLVLGAQAGLTPEEMDEVRGPVDSWSGADGVLMRFVDEMYHSDGADVTSWEALAERYPVDRMIEVTVLVGYYRMLAGFLNVVGVQVEDDGATAPRGA